MYKIAIETEYCNSIIYRVARAMRQKVCYSGGIKIQYHKRYKFQADNSTGRQASGEFNVGKKRKQILKFPSPSTPLLRFHTNESLKWH